MYTISKEPWGVSMAFKGDISGPEAAAWLVDIGKARKEYIGRPWHALVDMREMAVVGPEAQESFIKGQVAAREDGMVRACVILSSAVATLQAIRRAKESGIYKYERYIDGRQRADWQAAAMAWLEQGLDPDKP